jgi:hypothetical protein
MILPSNDVDLQTLDGSAIDPTWHPVSRHGACAAHPKPAGIAKGQRAIVVALDVYQHVEDRHLLQTRHSVRHHVPSRALFGIKPIDFNRPGKPCGS